MQPRHIHNGSSLRFIALLSVLGLLGLLEGLCPGRAQAQELEVPRPRQGYYFALGLHGANQLLWEDGAATDPGVGLGTTLRMGQMVTSHLGLGLQLQLAGTQFPEREVTSFAFGIEGQWEVLTNLSLLGGVALGTLAISEEDDDALGGSFGANWFLGVSYDWFFGGDHGSGGWALSPLMQVNFLPGEQITSLTIFVGLQISRWTGLPCNQLDLPDDAAYAP